MRWPLWEVWILCSEKLTASDRHLSVVTARLVGEASLTRRFLFRLALFQLLPARIGCGQGCFQRCEALHNRLKGGRVTAKQVRVFQLRMQPHLLGLQGFDALGKGVEFALLEVRQTLAWLFGWRRWATAWCGSRAWLARLAPVAVAADVFTHAAVAFEGIDGGDYAVEKGAVVRGQEQGA